MGLYVEGEEEPRQRSTVSFHTFRHTCASLLFAQGRNVKQVQEWLGHADPSFTLRTYVHLMDEGVGDPAFLDAEVDVGGAGGSRLGVVPKHVVHPDLLGGWRCRSPSNKEEPDEAPR